MSVYRRGQTWWFKFKFSGQAIRESAKTSSKTVAKSAERTRRRELEEGSTESASSSGHNYSVLRRKTGLKQRKRISPREASSSRLRTSSISSRSSAEC